MTQKKIEIKLRLTNGFVGLLKTQLNLDDSFKERMKQTPKDVLAVLVLGEAMGDFVDNTYSHIGDDWLGLIEIIEDGRKVVQE